MRSLVRRGVRKGVTIKGLEKYDLKYYYPKIRKWFYVFYHERSNFVRTGMELPEIKENGFKVFKVFWDWNSKSYYADEINMELSMDKLKELWIISQR